MRERNEAKIEKGKVEVEAARLAAQEAETTEFEEKEWGTDSLEEGDSREDKEKWHARIIWWGNFWLLLSQYRLWLCQIFAHEMEKDTYKYIADDDSSLDNIQRTVHFVPRNSSANGHKADHRSLASSSWNLMSRSNFYQLGLLTNKNKKTSLNIMSMYTNEICL